MQNRRKVHMALLDVQSSPHHGGGTQHKAGLNQGEDATHLLSPPGAPYDPQELQRAFSGMSPRDVYALLCKRCGCKPLSSLVGHPVKPIKALLSEKPGDWGSIVELDLSRSYIGPRGVVPLLELCKLLDQLQFLNLSQNFLNNQSIWHVCKVLAYHPTLTRLDCSGNDISWTAGMCILELVAMNPNVIRVGLNDTLVYPNVVATITAQIRRNMTAGARGKRRGPNPSNHPVTIRLRSLKRLFREALSKESLSTSGTTGGNIGGRLPKSIIIDGLKESYKLTGKEQELEHRSPAFYDRYLSRVATETVDWEAFMLVVMYDDVTVNEEAIVELRKVFDHFDVDECGYVGYSDLGEMMTMMRHGAEPTLSEVQAKLEAHDADDTMTLNWDEFLLLMYDKGPSVGELSTFHSHTPMRQRRPHHY